VPRLTLRDYQEECLQAHYDWFARNKEGNPLFVVPTGGGKSLIIAEFIRRSLEAWPRTRFLVVTHVRELIAQNYAEFVDHWGEPFHPAGIYSAGIGRRDARAQVLFAGIQSIAKKAKMLGSFDLVLIDEAHLVPKSGMGRYRTYLEALREINPNVRLCGYTATHYRLDGGFLHKGEGRIFTDVAYEVRVDLLIQEGHLSTLVAKRVENTIDTTGVKSSGGDFNGKALEEAATGEGMVEDAVAEMVTIARREDRHHWLIFGTGIAHAEALVEELKKHDVHAECIFGSTPKEDRDAIVQRFKDGKLPALVNVGVLTTGFNAPRCDLMAVMRPTQSTALYVQIMGRGMRTFPGKTNCLVLDYGANVERHGPINRVRPKAKGDAPPPTKTCPECDSIVSASLPICPDCGYIWPWKPRVIEHAPNASGLDPFDPEANKPKTYLVQRVTFRRHTKANKPDSLRVDYTCGMRIFSDWVCLEHDGFARRKAVRWWTDAGGVVPVPDTVNDALRRQHEIRQPHAIEVVPDGDYDRVRRLLFDPQIVDPSR
jgi:DNA repair protein RadD